MTRREKIQIAQRDAMKSGDAESLGTLRMLWSAIKNTEIDVHHELDDTDVEKIVSKQIKQLQDTIKDFKTGGRQDLIEKTKKELVVLEQYAPAQLSDAELEQEVSIVMKEMQIQNKADIGKAIGAVMKRVKGSADGNRVKAIVLRLLQ